MSVLCLSATDVRRLLPIERCIELMADALEHIAADDIAADLGEVLACVHAGRSDDMHLTVLKSVNSPSRTWPSWSSSARAESEGAGERLELTSSL
jgi:hypothetical protein